MARGNREAVLAAARDAEPGEILLHNHPSGRLEPSDADLALAQRIYQEGLGSGIVDNDARALYVVVEPPAPTLRPELDVDELEALLSPGGALSRVHARYEDRAAQRTMLREVARVFNEGGVAVVEAGTGTGKSLAYLLPAARWALLGGGRTVVSTNTINLQEQLVGKDLPLVRDLLAEGLGGDPLRWTLVKGRGNYVSIRRLLLAAETAPALFEDDRTQEMNALVRWIGTTEDGSLSDLPSAPPEEIWDEVRSDGDVCMGARCPHFQSCFYQRARRDANGAHLLIANHALLLTDIAVRRSTGNWSEAAVLPHYRHAVLDEGHNVEDAATRHLGVEVTRAGLFRALDRLDRSGKGLLAAVGEALVSSSSGEAPRLTERLEVRIRPLVSAARAELGALFTAIEPSVPGGEEEPLRLGRDDPRDPSTDTGVAELLDRVRGELGRLGNELEKLRLAIEGEVELADRLQGRLLDLQAVERRLAGARSGLSTVLAPGDDGTFVRWIEGRWRAGRLQNVLLAAAPAEPAAMLRDGLFDRLDGAVVTSATLATAGGDFRFVRERIGIGAPAGGASGPSGEASGRIGRRGGVAREHDFPVLADSGAEPRVPSGPAIEVRETLLPSPFDYRAQTVFGVPSDLPEVNAGDAFQEATARVLADVAGITGGGIFGLFTSHRALRAVARHLREAGVERRWPLLVHGEAPRTRLLDDFTRSEEAILLGTASFWEGVDVPGRPLRGLVLQKLPFRVPTEPITQARMEAIEARGESPFDSYLVPLAALRLKQGFGRLIRSRTDRGAVVLLDSRILTKAYGRSLLAALPDSPLLRGPWAGVRAGLDRFYGEA